MRGLTRIAPVVAALMMVFASGAHAQGTARSMDFEQSIRIAGMGGAGGAVAWGERSAWGNPATLGYSTGWGWEETRTQLVPGLADDIWIRTKRMTVGFGGVGVSWTGRPAGVGDVRLDYGMGGSYERVRGWGYGASLATLADRFGHRDGARSIARYGDLAFGQNFKEATVSLTPSPSGAARATNHDWGLLARLSPSSLLRHGRDGVWDVDVAVGHSVMNAGDEKFVFVDEDLAVSPTRLIRTGVAATGSLAQPTAMRMAFERLPLLSALGPLVRVTVSRDAVHTDTKVNNKWEMDQWGAEFSFLGVVDLRYGHVDDPLGEIVDDTRGIGLCIPLGKVARVRWDYAEVPQARDSGLPDVKRRSWSMWVDPAAIVRGRGGR
ncbi:MAG: hypothetical protein IT348_16670 [Candidatus Eisenbacteria bacterium]|nr:hypothetical protein [Candidatus Eisenbacteria bacterium]